MTKRGTQITTPRFTFKKEPRETGLRSVGNPYPNTRIKLAGKDVGAIFAPTYETQDRKWGVSFSVKQEPTPAAPCPFRWKTFKARFDSEPEAREFVRANAAQIVAWGLYAREQTGE